jgi:hypothetical protein
MALSAKAPDPALEIAIGSTRSVGCKDVTHAQRPARQACEPWGGSCPAWENSEASGWAYLSLSCSNRELGNLSVAVTVERIRFMRTVDLIAMCLVTSEAFCSGGRDDRLLDAAHIQPLAMPVLPLEY